MRETATKTHVTHLVGVVRDRPCIIVDDMISTGGTIAESISTLLEASARPEMYVVATHGLFLAGAREKIANPAVTRVFVTDSVEQPDQSWPLLEVVSIAPLVAGAIERVLADGSLSALF